MTESFQWPTFPLPASLATVAVVILAVLILIVSSRFDPTGGLLTLSIMIVTAFVAITFTVLLYKVEQTALVEILIGAMATSVGAIVAYWMSARK